MTDEHPENQFIERLIEYAASFDPSFPGQIVGVSRAEMLQLERCAGISLPDAYYGYVSRMGRASGKVELVTDGSTAFSDVLRQYEQTIRSGAERLSDRCVVLAVGELAYQFICVDLSEPPDAPVRFTANERRLRLISESLEKLLYRHVFYQVGLPRMAHCGFFFEGTKQPSVDRYAADFEGRRFERKWFSDSVAFCGERDDARVYVEQIEGQGTTILLGCESRDELEGIGALIEVRLGARRKA